MKSEMRSNILQLTSCSKSSLVSITRIDSDDILQKEALSKLVNCLEYKENVLYNFGKIICFDLKRKIFTNFKQVSGPFITLVTSINKDRFNSIFDYSHHDWPSVFEIRQIDDEFYAIQIIHGGNLINRLQGNFMWNFSINTLPKHFKLNHKIII